ncbi:MAG: squalene/phytoene synthase family protein [Candidatus Omnitrophica bacterium]|nr:squalene/phytoene synthase family protein [Candidatus Omnitrophota bacterium]
MNTPKDTAAQKGFAESRDITKKWAKSFYFASLFLPKEKRYASYAVYAVCRACDYSVDNITDTSKSQNLSRIKEIIKEAYEDIPLTQNVALAFRETIRTYQIPKEYFDNLIDGMSMDLTKNRYENFEELHAYCYKVAGIVGLIMLKILGHNHKEAEHHAVDLGIAMQLTNILRDIKEDYSLNRIYLPRDEMISNHLNDQTIAEEQWNEDFRNFMKFQIARARKYYENSAKGIPMISSARSRLVVLMMKDIYSGILTAIERTRYDIFAKRVRVSMLRKIFLLLRILLKGQFMNP